MIFASDRDGDGNIYAINVDGTRLSTLTQTDVAQCCAVASPDASTVAVIREDKLWLVRSNGATSTLVRGAEGAYDPLWSPDGRRLALRTERALLVADARTSRARRVVHGGSISDVSWSPDSRHLAFVLSPPEEARPAAVSVVDANGRNFARLEVATLGAGSLSWSPDGRWLSFLTRRVTNERYATDLVLLSPDGSRRRVVAEDVDTDVSPVAWSPNGRWLAFSLSGTDGIYVLDAHADAPTPRLVASGVFASWSPESERLAFYDDEGIGIADIEGGGLAHFPGDSYSDVKWSPDGRRLALTVQPPRHPAVAIITADGNAVAQIAVPTSVESLEWAPDGARILFAVSSQHFARATTDLYVARSNGTHIRMLTHRGDNQFLAWRIGRVPARLRRKVPLPPTESASATGFDARAPIVALAADGSRVAAVVADRLGDCSHVSMWSARSGAIGRLETPSGGCSLSDFEGSPSVTDFALAGARAAWALNVGCGNTVCGFRMATGTLARPGIDVIFDAEFDKEEPSPAPFNLHGHGSLLVYGRGPTLSRLGTGRSPDCDPECTAINTTQDGKVVDVDSGRIALLAKAGVLAIIDSSGATVRTLQFAPSDLRAVKLDGPRVVVRTRRRLESYSIATTALTGTAPAPTGRFADAARGIAVFTQGRTLHALRIADRRSWTLTTPGGPVHGQLEPCGLFYSYTTRGRWRGHVRFLPFRLVLARLR